MNETNTIRVLMIAKLEGVEGFAASVERQMGVRVELALTRRAGLAALRRSLFDLVVVEECLVESDAEWADRIWQGANYAMPLVLNFGTCGATRLIREVRAALVRRASEKQLARRAATVEIANELKTTLTGLLLHSELALRNPGVPDAVQPALLHVVELAGAIRDRLGPQMEGLERMLPMVEKPLEARIQLA